MADILDVVRENRARYEDAIVKLTDKELEVEFQKMVFARRMWRADMLRKEHERREELRRRQPPPGPRTWLERLMSLSWPPW